MEIRWKVNGTHTPAGKNLNAYLPDTIMVLVSYSQPSSISLAPNVYARPLNLPRANLFYTVAEVIYLMLPYSLQYQKILYPNEIITTTKYLNNDTRFSVCKISPISAWVVLSPACTFRDLKSKNRDRADILKN